MALHYPLTLRNLQGRIQLTSICNLTQSGHAALTTLDNFPTNSVLMKLCSRSPRGLTLVTIELDLVVWWYEEQVNHPMQRWNKMNLTCWFIHLRHSVGIWKPQHIEQLLNDVKLNCCCTLLVMQPFLAAEIAEIMSSLVGMQQGQALICGWNAPSHFRWCYPMLLKFFHGGRLPARRRMKWECSMQMRASTLSGPRSSGLPVLQNFRRFLLNISQGNSSVKVFWSMNYDKNMNLILLPIHVMWRKHTRIPTSAMS